jgi:hypothetical protein
MPPFFICLLASALGCVVGLSTWLHDTVPNLPATLRALSSASRASSSALGYIHASASHSPIPRTAERYTPAAHRKTGHVPCQGRSFPDSAGRLFPPRENRRRRQAQESERSLGTQQRGVWDEAPQREHS